MALRGPEGSVLVDDGDADAERTPTAGGSRPEDGGTGGFGL